MVHPCGSYHTDMCDADRNHKNLYLSHIFIFRCKNTTVTQKNPYWELGEIYKSSFMSMDDFVPLNIKIFDSFFECHLLKGCRFILYLFMGFLLHLSVALTIKIKLRKWCLHFLFPGFVNSPLYLPLHRLTEFNPALLLLGDYFSSNLTKGNTIGSYDKREDIVSDAIE